MGTDYAHHKEANPEERLARVAKMMQQGLGARIIAERLGVSDVTARKLREEVNAKTSQARSSAQRANRQAGDEKIAGTHRRVAEIIERAQRASERDRRGSGLVGRLVSPDAGDAAAEVSFRGAKDPDS